MSPFAQQIGSQFFLMELNLGVIALAEASSQLHLIASNLPFLLFTMTFLGKMALNAFLHQRLNRLYLSSASEVKGEEEAALYLDCLGELARKVENEEEDMILISLRKRHGMVCTALVCFCDEDDASLSDFIKEYISHELDVLVELFPNSPSLLLSILYFRMVLFRLYPTILSKTTEYKNHFNMTVSERFYCFWLTNFIQNFIQHKNK